MIYRIMYNTNSMNADADYIEMAQLLGDAALPGEAAAVLDKAMANGVIKDEHKERTNRLLTALRGRADTDKKGLPQQEAEANKSAAGELLVKLGEVVLRLRRVPENHRRHHPRPAEGMGDAPGRGSRLLGSCTDPVEELRGRQEHVRRHSGRFHRKPANSALAPGCLQPRFSAG